MLSALRDRRSGLFTLGVALLLLVATLTTAPGSAEDVDPWFTVQRNEWGSWINGNGWPGTHVEILITDPSAETPYGPWTVEYDAGNPGTFGFSPSGDAAHIAAGWEVEVHSPADPTGAHVLAIPLLTVDNVHTDDGTVHGSASPGLVFDVEACPDGPDPCDVQLNVTGEAWSTLPLAVSDRNIKAAYMEEDGDRYEAQFAWPRLQYTRGQSGQGIGSHHLTVSQFEPGTSVEITIDDPDNTYGTYDEPITVDLDGNGSADVDLAVKGIPPSDASGNPTVEAGWTFTALGVGSDGEPIGKVITNTGLTLDAVDQNLGTASGRCSDGIVSLGVVRGWWSGGEGETQEIPCVAGTWMAEWVVDELAVPLLVPGTHDGDGDQFAVIWERARVDVGGGASQPEIGFHFWSPNEDAVLEVWDNDGQPVTVVNDGLVPLTAYPDPSDPRVGFWLVDFIDPVPLSLTGWVFRVSTSTQVKVLTIEDLAIDVADDGTVAVNESGEVTGTAPPFSVLGISTGDGSEALTVESDGSGHWAVGVDLSESTEVSLSMDDSDGDWSSAWAPVHGATGGQVVASLTRNWIGLQDWRGDTSVTVTVADVTETVEIGSPEEGSGGWLDLESLGVDLVPEMVIAATGDQSGVSKSLVLIDSLSITLFNPDFNQVGGTAPADAFVEVGVGNESGGCDWEVQADSAGDWFTDGVPESCPDGFAFAVDMGVGAAVSDDDGDRTLVEFGQEGQGGGEPFLHVSAYGEEFIHGNNFDSDELRVIEIANDPACTGRAYTTDWEWQFDGAQFCEDGDLKPGHHVQVSYVLEDGETPGEVIRELTVHDAVITGADLADDSVEGLATPDSPVLVGVAADPGEPFSFHAQRVVNFNPGDSGAWSVSFNEAPTGDPEENWGQMEIDDQEVKVFQFDEDGDFTTSDWAYFEPHLLVNAITDFVFLQGWPTGSDITFDVFESDAADAILIHHETIEAPGPYYTVHAETNVGGVNLESGHYVVASNGIVEESHEVTAVSITNFDFHANSLTGTAYPENSIAASVWNDGGGSGVEAAVLPTGVWTAEFSPDEVLFREFDHIDGFVGEFDEAQNATFFMFAADYEELTVVPDGSTWTATTADGSITVGGLDSGEEISVTTETYVGSGGDLVAVGPEVTIESDGPPGEPGYPRILTLRILNDQVPEYVGPEDILVFRNGAPVSGCEPPLDDEDKYPCVSDRIRLEGTGDIELTVQTLEFSTWTMAFRSPSIDSFAADSEPVEVGSTVTAVGTFADVSEARAAELTATITWGDDQCEVVQIADGRVEASKVHDEVGVFTLALRLYAGSVATCDDAESLEMIDESQYQFVVVYDPDGGFVTGGGWIESPAGAYVADTSMTGEATFGFVSKYKKGAAVPTGNTQFQFGPGNLNFHSTSYDWLVGTGSPTAIFRGAGTINGEGEYEFMIWAGDGEPDTFRIKIWSQDGDGENVIFDNGSGQAIGGGSIKIHAAKTIKTVME